MKEEEKKVIAEPIGVCDESPCACECWCKAKWRIRYEGGEAEYVGCAGMAGRGDSRQHGYNFKVFQPAGMRSGDDASRILFLRRLFGDLETQQPDRWKNHPEKLIPLHSYWRGGDGWEELSEFGDGVVRG